MTPPSPGHIAKGDAASMKPGYKSVFTFFPSVNDADGNSRKEV